MPRIGKTKVRLSCTIDHDLMDAIEGRTQSSGVSKSEFVSRLLYRGLLAEDVETIRSDLEGVVSKITNAGGLNRSELLVLLEILGYMRIMFAENQPSNVERAKLFAEKAIKQLTGDE